MAKKCKPVFHNTPCCTNPEYDKKEDDRDREFIENDLTLTLEETEVYRNWNGEIRVRYFFEGFNKHIQYQCTLIKMLDIDSTQRFDLKTLVEMTKPLMIVTNGTR